MNNFLLDGIILFLVACLAIFGIVKIGIAFLDWLDENDY